MVLKFSDLHQTTLQCSSFPRFSKPKITEKIYAFNQSEELLELSWWNMASLHKMWGENCGRKREFYCRNTQRADLQCGADYVELIYTVGQNIQLNLRSYLVACHFNRSTLFSFRLSWYFLRPSVFNLPIQIDCQSYNRLHF